jgi:tetratricopeptide (TPR) repeat protein
MFKLFAALAALAISGCAHADQPEVSALRCGDRHTRPEAAAAVAACDRELAAAVNAPLADRVRLHYGRGVALTNTRDLVAAIEALSEVISLDPTHAPAYRLRGYVYWRQRQLDLAMADTQEALRLDPNMAMAYYSRGLIYSLSDQGLDAAIVEVTRAHEIEPENPVFLTTRCRMSHAVGGDLALALADCNRALELRPQHADTHEYRGRVLLQSGRVSEALADFDLALALDPELASARYGRGLARTRLGQDAEGRAEMDAAIAEDETVAALFVTPRQTY